MTTSPYGSSIPPTHYRRHPKDFKPWELAGVAWFRCKRRKQCYSCDQWIDVGALYAVVTHQAICRGCHSVALGVQP